MWDRHRSVSLSTRDSKADASQSIAACTNAANGRDVGRELHPIFSAIVVLRFAHLVESGLRRRPDLRGGRSFAHHT